MSPHHGVRQRTLQDGTYFVHLRFKYSFTLRDVLLTVPRFVWQVATFILQKILLDDTGLAYICQTYERFSHVAMILVRMILYFSALCDTWLQL